jgi:hypothetical protein
MVAGPVPNMTTMLSTVSSEALDQKWPSWTIVIKSLSFQHFNCLSEIPPFPSLVDSLMIIFIPEDRHIQQTRRNEMAFSSDHGCLDGMIRLFDWFTYWTMGRVRFFGKNE